MSNLMWSNLPGKTATDRMCSWGMRPCRMRHVMPVRAAPALCMMCHRSLPSEYWLSGVFHVQLDGHHIDDVTLCIFTFKPLQDLVISGARKPVSPPEFHVMMLSRLLRLHKGSLCSRGVGRVAGFLCVSSLRVINLPLYQVCWFSLLLARWIARFSARLRMLV